MTEILPYVGAARPLVRYVTSPGNTLSLWFRPINSTVDPDEPAPYDVEDGALSFPLRIWDEVTGETVIDSGEDELEPYRHTGTETAVESGDVSELEYEITNELAAERLLSGSVYRGELRKVDSALSTDVRLFDIEIRVMSDIR